MGKKDAKADSKEKEKKDADSEEEDEFEEDASELQQVEIGDFVKVKQTLDESVIKAVLDLDYTENHYWDNIKLLLMVVACLFAMVAQFYPMPFPDSRPLLGVCCAAYFVASSVLQLIVTYIEKDCIMITGPTVDPETGKPTPLPPLNVDVDHDGKSPAVERNKTRVGGTTGLRICTAFPRFSYDYTVAVQLNEKEVGEKEPQPNTSSMRFKIHDYFTEEGLFDEDRFERHVASVVKDFEQGDYYVDRAWANKGGEGKKEK
mmetsp:Transcript_13984/g.27826  ORF Transcript_13984/g.27826 Transcript_13984/m.27826 type:complete len:260 (+) Transcript_13984:20-799(+)